MLKRARETLIQCFEAVAGRHRRGRARGRATVRRLTGAAKAPRPSPARGRAAADLLRLDQAYRDFRGGQGRRTRRPRSPLPPPDLAPAFEPLLEPSRYKGAYGGRGSGKSHAFAELLVRRCIEAAPVRAVCIREVQRSLDQSVKRLIEDKIQALGVGAAFRVQADRILAPGGGRIIFQGMQNHTAESIKSLEGYDIAWVEEAQALSIRSLDLLRPTIRKPGSELWFSWNPTRAERPGRRAVPRRAAAARLGAGAGELVRQPAFPGGAAGGDGVGPGARPGQAPACLAGRVPHRQRGPGVQELEGGGVRDAGRCPLPVRRRLGLRPATRRCWCAASCRGGRCSSTTRPIRSAARSTARRRCSTPCRGRGAGRSSPTAPGRRRSATCSATASAASPGSTKGRGRCKDGVEFLKAHDIVVHPRCRHLIDELALYSYRTHPKTGEILSELEDRENHAVDALRYAVEGCGAAAMTAR